MSETTAVASSDMRLHHIECLDRFSHANTNSFRAGLLLSSLVVIGLWSHLPHAGLLTWLFATWTAQTAHEAYSRYYRRQRGHGADDYRLWLRGFWLGAAVVGVCWSLPFYLFGVVNHDVVLLLVFSVAGVTAYGGVARANVLSVALVFEFAVVLPMCAWLFLQDTAIYRIMAAAALLYLIMFTPLLRKMNQMVTRTLLLDDENHRLSDEQKSYHERLRRREEEYRTLAANLPVAVIRYDQEQRRRYINPAAQRMLHGNIPQMLGLLPGEGGVPATPEMIERYRGRMAEVLATGTILEFEFALDALPEGRHEHYHVRMAPEYGGDGKVTGALTIWFDITERKRAEAALEESSRLLHNVLQGIPDPVWMKDADGVYVVCNQGVARLFNMPVDEIIGKDDDDFFPPEQAEFYRNTDRSALEAGRVLVNEEWWTFGDNGEQVLMETRKTPVRNPDGRLLGVLGVARDITERKRLAEALAEREREFRTLAENFPDIIIRYDAKCRRIYANPAFLELAGWSQGETIGATPEKATPLTDPKGYMAELSKVMHSGIVSRLELSAHRENGELAWYATSFVPECDAEGKIIGVLVVSRDITERKQADTLLQERYERIVELNAHLEENARTLEEQAVELEVSKEQLMLTEAWYRGILQSAPDGMVVVDERGVIRLVNEQLCRMFGYQDSELTGQVIELLVPLDSHTAHRAKRSDFTESGSSGRPMAGDRGGLRACRKDGSEFFVDVSLARLPVMDGAVGTICAAIRDVTERKRMEQALAEREQEFRTLVENSVDTVSRYGPDLRRLYANPALVAQVEGGAAALLGSMPSECPGGVNAATYESKLAEVFAEGRGNEFELQWSDSAGREVCSLVSMTPEFDAQGEVASVLAVGRDITELNAFRHRIHQMAFYDSLTSLPNRALFNDRLRQMITDAAWHGQQAGLMMIDMDRFKAVNDTLGHPAGDELLRETAARLSTCVRAYDTVARLGGDEFAILLPEIRVGDDLGRIAGKILAVFERPFLLEGKEVFVSCSIGIALYPCDSLEADDLFKYADSAMYSAKRSGRNNFCFYSRDLTESAHERLVLESDLRRAIGREELELFYQPKVSLGDGALAGSEALLRWKHPERGMVPPDVFIDIAEDSGLIVEIGEWVLLEACRTACRWNGDGKPLHKVAINLSARQFQWGDLDGIVRRALQESGCRAEWIELEITESLLLDEAGGVLEVLNGFRAMGISIAIDDFGTGYSALSYLARFPIETLKIDRSFISCITTDEHRAELVKAILSIARCLGQLVVAEGVETEEQAAFLLAHGCQLAQGYLYGRPMPADVFSAASHVSSPPCLSMQACPGKT